jgi:hypothetical protein
LLVVITEDSVGYVVEETVLRRAISAGKHTSNPRACDRSLSDRLLAITGRPLVEDDLEDPSDSNGSSRTSGATGGDSDSTDGSSSSSSDSDELEGEDAWVAGRRDGGLKRRATVVAKTGGGSKRPHASGATAGRKKRAR